MSGIAYRRPARSYPPPLPAEPFEIASPPTIQPAVATGGALMYLLPALASVASVGFLFTFPGMQRNRAMVVLVVLIVLLSMSSGVLMWWLQARAARQRRRWERRRYLEYLAAAASELAALAAQQAEKLAIQHPGPPELAELAATRERVWERRRPDEDFLALALGRGRAALCREVLLQAAGGNPLVEYDSDLLGRARTLALQYRELESVAVEVDLRPTGTIAVDGDPAASAAAVRALLTEAAVLCGPDELQVAVLSDAARLSEWEWAKWLPHCRRSRMARTGHEQAAALLAIDEPAAAGLIGDVLLPRLGAVDGPRPGPMVMPHLLLVLDGPAVGEMVDRLPDAERLLSVAAGAGVTIIRLPDSGRTAAAGARLEVSASGLLTFEEAAYGGRRLGPLRAASCGIEVAERVARALAPLRLEEKERARDLGDTIRLVELLGHASVEEVDPPATWAAGPPFGLLTAPVGERLDGKPVLLDLKEAAEGGMGPHGLIVGATGSGKSELLRTVVSALAVTHDPEDLNFVFVDFKGGAAFADLARLPHTAGMITNIESDLTLVDRMQAALFGEQERRQRLLREAGNADSIRQYRSRRRGDPTLPPLPYLLLIVDEFGELLANRPDFLDLFVTLGRVGRSLGMHLLLATQRLDEGRIRGLEGHLRYRVCLRTFSPEESMTVLGSPDAHRLPPYPGAGYLRVDGAPGLFKVALVSTPAGGEAGELSVHRFTPAGRIQRLREDVEADGRSEMDVMIERASGRRAPAHQVWLPPLPARIDLGDLRRDASQPLQVAVGMVDLPRAQRQEPLVLDFAGLGGHLAVVGAPQSGKSTLLRTLAISLALGHSPRDVQCYICDLGGGLLRPLEAVPHVGAVAGKAERERLLQVVHHVESVIDEREAFFREQGLDGMAAYRREREAGRLGPDARYGDVFLVVDGVAEAQGEVEQVEPALIRIATNGLSYGVHLVVAANRWADIRPRLRDALGSRLELRLNDPADSEVGRAAAMTLPAGVPGRGLTRESLHFQAALTSAGASGLEAVLAAIAERWRGHDAAPPVLSLPVLVTAAELPPGALGVEESRLAPIEIDLGAADPHCLVFGDGGAGKSNLLRTWVRGLTATRSPTEAAIYIVDYRRTLADLEGLDHVRSIAGASAAAAEIAAEITAELERREPPGLGRAFAGRHIYLFVDDYEWVAAPTGSPLAALVDAVLAGRDLGFHVVLARRVGGTTRSSFEPLFQRLREMGTPGLVLAGDPGEGPVLGAVKAGAYPPGRGLLVTRSHKPVLVQVAFTPLRPSLQRAESAPAG